MGRNTHAAKSAKAHPHRLIEMPRTATLDKFDRITAARKRLYATGLIRLEGNRQIPKDPLCPIAAAVAQTYNDLAQAHVRGIMFHGKHPVQAFLAGSL